MSSGLMRFVGAARLGKAQSHKAITRPMYSGARAKRRGVAAAHGAGSGSAKRPIITRRSRTDRRARPSGVQCRGRWRHRAYDQLGRLAAAANLAPIIFRGRRGRRRSTLSSAHGPSITPADFRRHPLEPRDGRHFDVIETGRHEVRQEHQFRRLRDRLQRMYRESVIFAQVARPLPAAPSCNGRP